MSRDVEKRILSNLHGHKTRTRLTQIHAHILRHCLHQSNQVLAHFTSVCGLLNKMFYAESIFQQTENPNILLFNSMIKGYSRFGPFENSLHFYSLMRSRLIWPDEYTFAPLLNSCSNLSGFQVGQGVHAETISLGYERFPAIRIEILQLYTSQGNMNDARKVFDEMLHRDVIVWNIMINGFCKKGDVETGLHLFRQMNERSVVSWNLIISSLARNGRDKEALAIFLEMQDDNNCYEPDDATLVSILPVCARLGADAIDVGQKIHSYAESSKLINKFINVGNSIVDFYCKCGNLEKAFIVFKKMKQKNVVSWNTMISGLALNGEGEQGVDLFEEMISKGGVAPNHSTFVGTLTCCAHSGLVEKGLDYFGSMIVKYEVEPKIEHYGIMVDLLGRVGRVKEAYEVIRSMPMKANAAIWGALLSGCRTYDNLDIAEFAVKELIEIEPWNSGNYVLLSNMLAGRNEWDEVEKVRLLMKENSILKAAGQSIMM
ncbi:pentatricopeptide repeat-containing protein At1g09190 [Impatiens glandulifera]|uniref:pentatricopeptide repeat-containing protein At1g09190 n=1 Tax=Impatiens glandulifera TaxID=253017 RepID=UPI001FB0FB9A|nr:pentatricopeptide repeat-containing protein At1g09190 [Impatiens glandulifera]